MMFDPSVSQLAAIAALVGVTSLLLWFVVRGVPFPLFHFWVNLPVIGRIARLARLAVPSNDEANRRLDEVFHGYRKRIVDVLTRQQFDRARAYLFLAGDADTHPTPPLYLAGLFALLGAEAYSYSFMLGGAASPDASDNQVKIFAVVITIVFAFVYALLSHVVGGMLHRTRTLRGAWPQALDESRSLAGERPMVELVSRISLDEDQDRDEPRKAIMDAQRQLNRVRRHATDRGGYLLPAAFGIAILGMAYLQYELRALSNIATGAANLALQGDLKIVAAALPAEGSAAWYANLFFVLIFLLTQAVSLWLGYTHAFVGVESKRAYRLISGADAYARPENLMLGQIRCADESLTNLLSKFQRYSHLEPDKALYAERVAREMTEVPAEITDGGGNPPTAAAGDNVTPLPIGGGGK